VTEPIAMSDETKAAVDHLQHHYQIFGQNFSTADAIDKSASLQIEFLETDVDWMEERRMVRSMEIHPEWT